MLVHQRVARSCYIPLIIPSRFSHCASSYSLGISQSATWATFVQKRRRRDLKPRLRAVILEALAGQALDPLLGWWKSWKERKLPFGEHTKSNGKSPFLMGKSENPLFLWPFSIAMLVHQRVSCLLTHMLLIFWFLSSLVHWKWSWFNMIHLAGYPLVVARHCEHQQFWRWLVERSLFHEGPFCRFLGTLYM